MTYKFQVILSNHTYSRVPKDYKFKACQLQESFALIKDPCKSIAPLWPSNSYVTENLKPSISVIA